MPAKTAPSNLVNGVKLKEVEPDNKWNTEDEYDPTLDPFGTTENREIVNNITLLRIYDILMSQLTASHPEQAKQLFELHERGGLLCPPPKFEPSEVYGEPE